jgi:hypothetical protein
MDGQNNPTPAAPTPAPAAPDAAPAPVPADLDYEKLASIVAGKQSVAEEKVINGFFKEQGLSGDERNEAIEMYKAYKASKTPNVEDLQNQISEYGDALAEAQSDALYAQAELAAYQMAAELGVDGKAVPYLMKMADLSNVVSEGQIDTEVLKENLGAVLEDLPQLKLAPQEDGQKGFKIGADNSGQKDPNALNTELAQIFGVAKKG